MEKRTIIIPWISICCLLFGMYTGFATEFNYGEFNWPFLVGWAVVLSAAAVLLALRWKPWISGALTIPALILAGLYGYSHMEELQEAAAIIRMLLSKQMAKYNGTAVSPDAFELSPALAKTWGVHGSLNEGQMETLFLLCGFFIAVYISIVTMRLSFRIYGLVLPYTVMLVGLSVGASPGVSSVFFLFLGTALTLYWVERNETDTLGRVGRGGDIHLKIPWALAVLCLCIFLCTATSIFLNNGTQEEILSHAKDTLSWQHQKERQFKEFGNTILKAMKARFGVDNDGEMDNEPPEYGDKDVLRFTMDRKPTEDVYLRGFVGSVYRNGKWTYFDDNSELMEQIYEIVIGDGAYTEDKVDSQMLSLMELDTVGLMRTANKTSEGLSGIYSQIVGLPAEAEDLQMQYPEVNWKLEYIGVGRSSSVHYRPYFDWMEDTVSQDRMRASSADVREVLLYGGYGDMWGWQIDRTLKKISNSIEGTFYPMGIQQMQERADVFGEWAEEDGRVWSDLSAAGVHLRDDVLKAYLDYAGKEYTEVPEDLQKFTEFADNQGIYGDTTVDIAVQIRTSLWSLATYSKELKKVPEGEDYIEYFLLEQRKGFCEHFATAGTLLFRHYGVPAKFVSGYRIPVEAFVENEDGTYTANIQDSYAHAWSEVLIGGLGWYPMEMTPGAAGVVRGQYDEGEIEPTEQPQPTPTEEVLETATPSPAVSESPKAAQNSASPSQRDGNGSGEMTLILWGMAAALAVLLLCLSVWIWCRYSRGKYSRDLKKLQGKNSRAIRIMTEGMLCFLTDCGVRECEKMTEEEWIRQAFIMAEGGEIVVENLPDGALKEQPDITEEQPNIAFANPSDIEEQRSDITAENPSDIEEKQLDIAEEQPDIVTGNQSDMDRMRRSIEKAFFANEAVTSKECEEFLDICDTLTQKILRQMKGWHRLVILFFGWRKEFAEWKKLCYDRTK